MTKDEIIKLAKQAGFERLGHDDHDYVCYPDEIADFATLIAEKEREECARICDDMNSMSDYYGLRIELVCAYAIRARGQE